MKIIIVSGQANLELNSLTRGEAVGALQLVNKPVLNYTLEALQQQLKIYQFQVLGDNRSQELIEKVQKQLNWAIDIQGYSNEPSRRMEEVLWIRDDVVYDLDFNVLLQQAHQTGHQSVVFFSDNTPVLFYQKNNDGYVPPVFFSGQKSTEDFCYSLLEACLWHHAIVDNGVGYVIDSVAKYYHYSMDLLKGNFNTLVLDYHQQGLRLVKGAHVIIEDYSQQQQRAYLGDSVYIHPESQLHKQVIICEQSYLDSYVDISDSIVMSGVYIGSYLKINNSVVTQDSVICIETGTVLPIVDKNMITDIALRAG